MPQNLYTNLYNNKFWGQRLFKNEPWVQNLFILLTKHFCFTVPRPFQRNRHTKSKNRKVLLFACKYTHTFWNLSAVVFNATKKNEEHEELGQNIPSRMLLVLIPFTFTFQCLTEVCGNEKAINLIRMIIITA